MFWDLRRGIRFYLDRLLGNFLTYPKLISYYRIDWYANSLCTDKYGDRFRI